MLAILQPHIPHYRESFFKLLQNKFETRVYCYNKGTAELENFSKADVTTFVIGNLQKGPFLFYNPFPLLRKDTDVLVLMLHFGHITTWLLLLTKFIHRKKIVLWGQGISVKRYLQEEKKPDWKLRKMIALSDGVWIYTEKDAEMWQQLFPKKPIVGLNNTLECKQKSDKSKVDAYKKKYGITQKRILIFSARFENQYRRTDLLEKIIEAVDPDIFGFIIIGAGRLKPDFSKYKHVYDFGKLYDEDIKKELFSIADIYFQPGWVGLSVVEAMAYSLPIFTFRRTEEIKQCVEYAYIKDGENGCLFDNITQCISMIKGCPDKDLQIMGSNARRFIEEELTVGNMVMKAIRIL